MEVVLLLVRWLLSAVFALAAVAKLADRPGTSHALVAFGVPNPLARPLAMILPLSELAVAITLLFTTTAVWGAVGALILLALFVAAIAVNLAHGRRPDCHCFGQVHSAPVGGSTIARNVLLGGIAGLVVWLGPGAGAGSLVTWLADRTIPEFFGFALGVLLLGALLIQGWLVSNLLRQNGRILLRLDALEAAVGIQSTQGAAPALPIGSPAPNFRLSDLEGREVSLRSLASVGRSLMLIFSDPDCEPCKELMPEIGRWQEQHADAITIAVVSSKATEDNRPLAAEHGVANVLLQNEREVAEAYGAIATPTAVVVTDGAVGGAAAGSEAIRGLLARVLGGGLADASTNGHRGRAHPLPKIGDSAPPVSAPDLDGRALDLQEFRGRPHVVLFWSPSCSYCQQMLARLRAWERRPLKRRAGLLVVSTGSVEANRAMALRSPVVLDHTFAIGQSFGARGTPSAIFVDADGRIGSELAVGPDEVLKLLRSRPKDRSATAHTVAR